MSDDIRSALNELSEEDWDRLRLRLWKRFGGQLRNISSGKDPDDLLGEAVEGLLEGRLHYNLDKFTLVNCLFGSVRGKVSQIYERWKRDLEQNRQTVPIELENPVALPFTDSYGKMLPRDEPMENFVPDPSAEANLYDAILSLIPKDDELLKRMVAYRYEHQDDKTSKAQETVDALGVSVNDIYNANRRLKSVLIKFKQERNEE